MSFYRVLEIYERIIPTYDEGLGSLRYCDSGESSERVLFSWSSEHDPSEEEIDDIAYEIEKRYWSRHCTYNLQKSEDGASWYTVKGF